MAEPKRMCPVLYECGICGCYHPWEWNGDCRDDDNRYGVPEDYMERFGLGDVEVRTMDERMRADRRGEP